MFRRRVPKRIEFLLQDLVWPRMGWTRAFHYWQHRLFRNCDSTYKITAGLASGAAVSFSPFIGTHIIQALVLSRVLRANWLAGAAGTVWGNPWTFPFLWASSYMSGAWLLHVAGLERIKILPDYLDFEYFLNEPGEFFNYLLGHPLELLLPMTIGSLVAGVAFWFLAYGLLYYPVFYAMKAYRRQRGAFRERLGKMKQKIKK